MQQCALHVIIAPVLIGHIAGLVHPSVCLSVTYKPMGSLLADKSSWRNQSQKNQHWCGRSPD